MFEQRPRYPTKTEKTTTAKRILIPMAAAKGLTRVGRRPYYLFIWGTWE
jgi:hypothetical protein